MKRIIGFLLAACLVLLSACGGPSSSQDPAPDNSSAQSAAPAQTEHQETQGIPSTALEEPEPLGEPSFPVVYMTRDISPEGLMAVYEALEASPSGNIAVKLSIGEPGSNYLRPELIDGLVRSLENASIVECNTIYGGRRTSTAMHYQVAQEHGYTELAAVDVMDENGSMTLPVEGGDVLTENHVGANFGQYE